MKTRNTYNCAEMMYSITCIQDCIVNMKIKTYKMTWEREMYQIHLSHELPICFQIKAKLPKQSCSVPNQSQTEPTL